MLKKVFVYIHGGGLHMGSANEQVPGDWVVRGDVIVVTFNYRLSWLGFVKGNTPEAPGNLGWWDQLMAINWVKDNIRSFGGDPDDITIGGQSAGSASASVLSISPYAKDLFTKAVMLSYTVFTNTATPGSTDHLLYDLADIVGCDYNNRNQSEADNVVQCLRQVPAEAFSLPFDFQNLKNFVSIDEDLLPAPVSEMIYDEDYLTEIGFYSRDYINSLSNTEGAILLQGVFSIGAEDQVMSPEFVQALFGFPLPLAQQITKWYQEPGHYQHSPAYDFYGDIIFVLSNSAFVEAFASVKKDTYSGHLGNSYLMVWDFTPTYMPKGHQGFFHATELSYLFDLSPRLILGPLYYHLSIDKDFTEEYWNLKRRFIDTLSEFMRTGNPGVSLTKGITWPTFDSDTEYYLRLTPGPVIQRFPFKERRDFWKNLLS